MISCAGPEKCGGGLARQGRTQRGGDCARYQFGRCGWAAGARSSTGGVTAKPMQYAILTVSLTQLRARVKHVTVLCSVVRRCSSCVHVPHHYTGFPLNQNYQHLCGWHGGGCDEGRLGWVWVMLKRPLVKLQIC